MSRIVSWALLVVGLLLALAFFASEHVSQSRGPVASQVERSPSSATLAVPDAERVDLRASDTSAAQNVLSAPPSADKTALAGGKGFTSFPNTGPTVLTSGNEQRLLSYAEDLAGRDQKLKDFLTLLRSEERDDEWADSVERQLQASIRLHGSRHTALQIGVPKCSKTVCMILATGGMSSDAANADWQKLIYGVASEPWFQQSFIDMSTTMRGSPTGIMYVSYLIRKV